jgi:hypothetical protein
MKSEMRYLNRIVFINSAAIRYSEINLDGNVHLIGTQGVGKSTLLRSILFFYNADTQKLGIPLNKKTFAEHYFGFANSFIVYEIAREAGFICVMAFKSQGRISYRFIDSPYDRDFFISPDGKAYENWDRIRAKLDDSTITYSNKIDRYEEYRNILYGNNQELRNELKRFSILESKQYQNIPRTIQNVFLSSHLEAEFIKQTIIMSLNEDDIKINLDTYNHHLSNFESQINDINLFRQPAKAEQADSIARKYVELRRIEKEKKELAFQLGWTLHNNKTIEPELRDELAEKERKRDEITKLIDQINSTSEERRFNINEQISIIKGKLQIIKEKEKHYRDLNISDLIQRVDRKPDLVSEASGLDKEKSLLTKEFSKITEKYEAIQRELKHQHEAYVQRKKAESLENQSTFLKQKDTIQEAHGIAIQAIRDENAQALKEAHRNAMQRLDFTKSLQIKEAEIKHSVFFDKEIRLLEAEILKLQQSDKDLALENTLTENQIKTFQQQWENEEKNEEYLFTIEQEKRTIAIQALTKEISDVEGMIRRQANSLHGWLTENVNGWENTIGKVCSEEVLFLEHLQPALLGGSSQSLYGVNINLTDIAITPKTLADYRHNKKTKEAEVDELKTQFVDSQKAHQSNLEKIKKRFQPKIKEKKDRKYEIDYDLQKNSASADQKKVKLSDLLAAAKSEKEKALANILTEIQRAELEQRNVAAKEVELENKISDQIKRQELLRIEKLKVLTETNDGLEQNIKKDIEEKTASHDERLHQIKQEEEGDLKNQGVNINRLNAISVRIESLEKELKYIEDVATKEVFGYRKDKAELLDHKQNLDEQKREFEAKLLQEEAKRSRKVDEQGQKVTKIESKISELNKHLETIAQDFVKFEDFKNSDCHLNIGHHLNTLHEEFATDLAATQIVERLNASYYSGITKSNELKEGVNKFLSNFSAGNIFNFKINLTSDDEYQQFATELSDFISQDRISEFERRVNERYAEIIKMIGKETTEFTSREGEISKIIRNINDDFEKKNFVGIIQKIELRMDHSTNPIVEILKLIKKFNDENSIDLGEANLFTSADRDSMNKKAVDFLKQFVKEIEKSKRDFISLSDSFELKFRVVENHTDTGWVEKISNVGSEGTDILVKAMINIMLLNVFKEGASRKFKNFKLHCVMDEIGKLHPGNVRGLLKFANDRNILLINGSPTENDAMAFRHIYKLEKDSKAMTKVKRIISKLD